MKRYVLEADKQMVEETYGVSSASESLFAPNYNVIPGTSMPVVVKEGEKRKIKNAVWGLHGGGKTEIHAIEQQEVLKKDTLKKLASGSPCIIPASGFYKWKESVNDPLPFYLRVLKYEVLSLAGICTTTKTRDGKTSLTYAVLTMPANALVEPLDKTMPCILDEKEFDLWLGGGAVKMLEDGFSGNHLLPDMAVFRVPDLVNNPANNSKELIQPIPKLRNED